MKNLNLLPCVSRKKVVNVQAELKGGFVSHKNGLFGRVSWHPELMTHYVLWVLFNTPVVTVIEYALSKLSFDRNW